MCCYIDLYEFLVLSVVQEVLVTSSEMPVSNSLLRTFVALGNLCVHTGRWEVFGQGRRAGIFGNQFCFSTGS